MYSRILTLTFTFSGSLVTKSWHSRQIYATIRGFCEHNSYQSLA